MPLKTCPACSTVQPLFAFYRDSTKADGLRAICKTCTASRQAGSGSKRREINARYYAANKDKIKTTQAGKPAPARPVRPKRSAFIGPPTRAQHAAALARIARRVQRRTDEADQVAQAIQSAPPPARPVTPKPSEAELAARKAKAIADAAALVALMRAPRPAAAVATAPT